MHDKEGTWLVRLRKSPCAAMWVVRTRSSTRQSPPSRLRLRSCSARTAVLRRCRHALAPQRSVLEMCTMALALNDMRQPPGRSSRTCFRKFVAKDNHVSGASTRRPGACGSCCRRRNYAGTRPDGGTRRCSPNAACTACSLSTQTHKEKRQASRARTCCTLAVGGPYGLALPGSPP
jgi:hypothetical protein